MSGPLFQTMFTIIGISRETDEYCDMYIAKTQEGSEIVAGIYFQTKEYGCQVVGPVGASPCQYDGPEAEKVFNHLKGLWEKYHGLNHVFARVETSEDKS